MATQTKTRWLTEGFEAFARGTFGNAGQNLYVSRAGVLQRIHQFDLNKDGHLDLVLCNSQSHWEKPPCYVYVDPLKNHDRIELPSHGAFAAAVADLTGNGYPDLVLGMQYDGQRFDLNATIYFGSETGYSQRYVQHLPAPFCAGVAAGDFDGDGKIELAFLTHGRLRLFPRTSLGFEPRQYVDLAIEGTQLGSGDLDGDGVDELLVRTADGGVQIYWGGDDGVVAERSTTVPGCGSDDRADDARYEEYVEPAIPLPSVVCAGETRWLFVPGTSETHLVPINTDRSMGAPTVLSCRNAMAASTGHIRGGDFTDLVIACREQTSDGEVSWVYHGDADGFCDDRRRKIRSRRACDVALCDMNGDGLDEIVLCQGATPESFTSTSWIYVTLADQPIELESEDARRVFVVRHGKEAPAQVVLVNHFAREAQGKTDVAIYAGGNDGFSTDRCAHLPGQGAIGAWCVDVNDNGEPDVIIANCSENAVRSDPGSFVFLNKGGGQFDREPSMILPTTRAHGMACADLNRNGYLDLIVVGFDNPEMLVFHGMADGFDIEHPQRIQLHVDGVTYKEPRWIMLADLNNDGWLDLVVPIIDADRSFIFHGGPDGFSNDRVQSLAVERAACARAADLTGNGYADLILGGHTPSRGKPHDSYIYIYWNGPEGMDESRRMLLPTSGANAISIADFNGDGLLDLFACSYDDGKSRDIPSPLYWNRPGRGFDVNDRTELATHGASGCVAADFNGDGYIDLAVANHKVHGDHVGYSEVWWNGENGFCGDRTTRLPSAGPHGMTSVEVGNMMDRGPAETYTSEAFELGVGEVIRELCWEATIPPGAWVKYQLRTADSRDALDHALWFEQDGSVKGPWFQYRLMLGAENGAASPRVKRVGVVHG